MKASARVVLAWAVAIVICVTLAVVVFQDANIITDHLELTATLVLIGVVSISSWRLRRRMKARMRRGLGRDVDDAELLSISAWMKIPDQAKLAAKEAEKYDFND
ncbi:MAG TPA: hypothetical protein VKM94_00775 [Blastocatellia bacterium]|nr:hypothetical protein [Blastocatellia bacterium]